MLNIVFGGVTRAGSQARQRCFFAPSPPAFRSWKNQEGEQRCSEEREVKGGVLRRVNRVGEKLLEKKEPRPYFQGLHLETASVAGYI